MKTQCIFCIIIFYLPILGVVKASTFRYFTSIFSPVLSLAFFDPSVDLGPGAQLGNFERGARYIFFNRKAEIIHGLSQSVNCVAPPCP